MIDIGDATCTLELVNGQLRTLALTSIAAARLLSELDADRLSV